MKTKTEDEQDKRVFRSKRDKSDGLGTQVGQEFQHGQSVCDQQGAAAHPGSV